MARAREYLLPPLPAVDLLAPLIVGDRVLGAGGNERMLVMAGVELYEFIASRVV
jgi:hypothetical protein